MFKTDKYRVPLTSVDARLVATRRNWRTTSAKTPPTSTCINTSRNGECLQSKRNSSINSSVGNLKTTIKETIWNENPNRKRLLQPPSNINLSRLLGLKTLQPHHSSPTTILSVTRKEKNFPANRHYPAPTNNLEESSIYRSFGAGLLTRIISSDLEWLNWSK